MVPVHKGVIAAEQGIMSFSTDVLDGASPCS